MYRIFRGRRVRSARKVVVSGKAFIKVTLETEKGKPGRPELVTPEQYEKDLVMAQKAEPQAGGR